MEEPRELTDDEIQDILSVLPNIKSAADTISQQNSKSMKVLLREQLKTIKLTPLGITDLKTEMLRQFNETVIRPGTTVGFTAAEALGKNVTQSALNSFHTSGAAKNVSMGVERITELINATKEPKKPSCSIYFKDQTLSFDDIIAKKRPDITEITVKDLVIGLPDIENSDDITEPDWYPLYKALIRDDFQAKDVLRLTIDPNLLYAYKLTMQDVCRVIEKGQPVVCVYSPISEGKIDIYPVEKKIVSKLKEMKIDIVSEENASLVFLSMIVVPALDKLRISGISRIKQIYPVEAGVWQIVKEEQPTKSFENGWFLILNPIRMKVTGITVEKLIRLLDTVGIKVLKQRPQYLAVSSLYPPTKVVNEAISKDLDDEKVYEKKKREEGARVIRRPPTEIAKNSKLIYADSTGANLRELFSHPDVDATRTYSNNVHEIRDALGIEAARTFLIKEFTDVIANEGYINPRHIVLLVDFMCSLGNVYGVTSTGVSRQPIGALEKASFEKGMKYLKEGAVFGEISSVAGTSASVFVGKRALIGTGYSREYIKPENLNRYNETRKQLETDPNMTLDIGAFNDAVEDLTLDIPDAAFLPSTLEEEMFAEVKDVPKEVQVVPKEKEEATKILDKAEGLPEPTVIIKGRPVRSAELEQAAELFKTAPILKPKPESVEELEKKMKEVTLPPLIVSKPTVSKPRAKAKIATFDIDEFLK